MAPHPADALTGGSSRPAQVPQDARLVVSEDLPASEHCPVLHFLGSPSCVTALCSSARGRWAQARGGCTAHSGLGSPPRCLGEEAAFGGQRFLQLSLSRPGPRRCVRWNEGPGRAPSFTPKPSGRFGALEGPHFNNGLACSRDSAISASVLRRREGAWETHPGVPWRYPTVWLQLLAEPRGGCRASGEAPWGWRQ